MASELQQDSRINDCGRDYDLAVAQYRNITELPGYTLTLRKPLEVALFETFYGGNSPGFRATHLLPLANNSDGQVISGTDKTEDLACQDLSTKIVIRYECLHIGVPIKGLSHDDMILQKQYLESIIARA